MDLMTMTMLQSDLANLSIKTLPTMDSMIVLRQESTSNSPSRGGAPDI